MPYLEAAIPTVLAALLLAAVIAILRELHPLSKWRHAAKRDSAILNALPPGDERDKWEDIVTRQAFYIRLFEWQERQKFFHLSRIAQWVSSVGIFVVIISLSMQLGIVESWSDLFESVTHLWPIPVIVIIALVWTVISNALIKRKTKKASGVAFGIVKSPSEGSDQ